MFCKTCGAKIPNDMPEKCPECGTKIHGNEDKNFCGECGERIENPKIKVCLNCGCSIKEEFYDMNKFDLSTGVVKARAKEISLNKEVDRKSIFTIAYVLPFIITLVVMMKVLVSMQNIEMAIFCGVIAGIINSFFIASLYMKVYSAISTGVAKFGLVFKTNVYIPIVIIGVIVEVLGNITLLEKGISPIMSSLLNIVLLVISVPIIMIYYIAVSRDYSVGATIGLGFKYGFKYFFRILWLDITFIPLGILIVITAGILGIFKGFYIQTSYCVLCEKILQKENII